MRGPIRTSDFWFLAGTFFVCGATSNGLVGQHFIPHAVDHGFTAVAASGALAVMGVFNFIGTIASGWLTDRWDPRRLLLVYYGFRGVSLLFLPFVHDTMTIAAFAVLFGLDYIATVPPTVALVADRFGRHNVGVVYGWVFAAHMVGAASRRGPRASCARTSATTRPRSWRPAGSPSSPGSPLSRSGARARTPTCPSSSRPRHDEEAPPTDGPDDRCHHRRLRPADLPDAAARPGARGEVEAGPWALGSGRGARGRLPG